jgi:5'-3' exonuclease
MNKGEYSTVFNFFRGIRPLIEKFNPDSAYFVLEGIPKKRLDIDPNYKGQREYNNKDNFNEQRDIIIDLLNRYFPITLVKHEDYECDDIIGYLANKNKEENNDVVIVSSDTDFIQCINDNVKLYNPVKKSYIEKPTHDYVLWKSLKGDASDNIQGFKGIGDKRAKKLCENKDELVSFLMHEGHKEKLDQNVFMIKLHDLSEDEDNIKYFDMIKKPDWVSLKEVFNAYEFSSITAKNKTWEKYTNTFSKLFQKGTT